jgi:hypothetical protein
MTHGFTNLCPTTIATTSQYLEPVFAFVKTKIVEKKGLKQADHFPTKKTNVLELCNVQINDPQFERDLSHTKMSVILLPEQE